jgi:hypothetical protein
MSWLQLQPNQFKDGSEDPLTLSESTNGLQDVIQMMFDPEFASAMAALTGSDTVDYMQMPEQQAPPVRYTPTLDALAGNAETAGIAESIMSGASASQVRKAIRSVIEDPDEADDLMMDAATAIEERDDFAKQEREFAAKPPELSPLEETWRDAGIPMPWDKYTPDTVRLPENFDQQFQGFRDQSNRNNMAAEALRMQARRLPQGHPAASRGPVAPGGAGPTPPTVIRDQGDVRITGGEDGANRAINASADPAGTAARFASFLADTDPALAGGAPKVSSGEGFMSGFLERITAPLKNFNPNAPRDDFQFSDLQVKKPAQRKQLEKRAATQSRHATRVQRTGDQLQNDMKAAAAWLANRQGSPHTDEINNRLALARAAGLRI